MRKLFAFFSLNQIKKGMTSKTKYVCVHQTAYITVALMRLGLYILDKFYWQVLHYPMEKENLWCMLKCVIVK